MPELPKRPGRAYCNNDVMFICPTCQLRNFLPNNFLEFSVKEWFQCSTDNIPRNSNSPIELQQCLYLSEFGFQNFVIQYNTLQLIDVSYKL